MLVLQLHFDSLGKGKRPANHKYFKKSLVALQLVADMDFQQDKED